MICYSAIYRENASRLLSRKWRKGSSGYPLFPLVSFCICIRALFWRYRPSSLSLSKCFSRICMSIKPFRYPNPEMPAKFDWLDLPDFCVYTQLDLIERYKCAHECIELCIFYQILPNFLFIKTFLSFLIMSLYRDFDIFYSLNQIFVFFFLTKCYCRLIIQRFNNVSSFFKITFYMSVKNTHTKLFEQIFCRRTRVCLWFICVIISFILTVCIFIIRLSCK